MSETETDAPAKPLSAALYEGVSADAPAGPAPKREDVAPLRELCEGKQGTYVSEENPNMGGSPPDFRAARTLCMELLERSRDIRVLVRLVQAEANTAGAPGLHAALHLLDAWLRKDWEALHPGPADDRLARRERAQAFAPLTSPALAAAVESVRLFKGAGLDGDISLRDFLLASGRRTAAAGEVARPPEGLAEVIARAKAEETVIAAAKALSASSALLRAIETTLKGAPEFPAPRFDRLVQAVDQLANAVKPFAVAPGAAAEEGEAGDEGEAAAAPAAASAPIGALTSREAALALLDEVIAYYAVSARSSPLPLALLKLRGMHAASYPEWVAALAADGPDYAALTMSGVDPAELDAFVPEEGAAGAETPSWASPLAAAKAALAALAAAAPAPAESAAAAESAGGQGEADGEGEAGGAEGEAAEAGDGAEAAAAPEAGSSPGATGLAALTEALEGIEAALRALPAPPATRPAGRIRDRAGVKAALTQIAAYFSAAEPANPIAICLTRANGLVEMNFMDTLTELAPKGGDTLSLSIAPKS